MLPFGSRTLYANAQMVRLLGAFARESSKSSATTAGETRYARARDRFIAGINARLWE
jgi:hypothetical protein